MRDSGVRDVLHTLRNRAEVIFIANESAKTAVVSASPGAAGPDWTAMPSVPTGVVATAGNAQVRVTWNAVSNALSYNVYGGPSGNGTNQPLLGNTTTPGYLATGLANGLTYNFQVTAVN